LPIASALELSSSMPRRAESPGAAQFYRRIDPGFMPSPTDPLHLILLLKDLGVAIPEAAVTADT
jgi:hypothetical protein